MKIGLNILLLFNLINYSAQNKFKVFYVTKNELNIQKILVIVLVYMEMNSKWTQINYKNYSQIIIIY